MLSQNFITTAQDAMNQAAKLTRDKGLLENALTMTSFSMPSQADVIDYEITLLTEKKNQIVGYIEELATEAAERLAEMNAERAAIQSEMEHYKNEYSEALRRQAMARHLYGANSQQVEKHHAAFAFACELYDKAKAQLTGIGVDILELEATLVNIRDFLTGETPSVIATESDDLPFASEQPAATATALSMETFEALAKKHVTDIISYVERHRDLRDETEDALTEAVITEISRGKVSVNDIFQSFDEVLEDEFAGFYEALEAAQETDKATLQHELAASVEAYA